MRTARELYMSNINDAVDWLIYTVELAQNSDVDYAEDADKALNRFKDLVSREYKLVMNRDAVSATMDKLDNVNISDNEFMMTQLTLALGVVETMIYRIDNFCENHNERRAFSKEEREVINTLYTDIQRFYSELMKLKRTETEDFRVKATDFYSELMRVSANAEGEEKEKLDEFRRAAKKYLWPGTI